MLNKIVTPPRVARAWSSNLALLSHIEVPADHIAPFESQRTSACALVVRNSSVNRIDRSFMRER